MGMLAWIFGILGGLCAVMGIITAVDVVPVFAAFTATLWMTLAVVLLLICIAAAVSRSRYE